MLLDYSLVKTVLVTDCGSTTTKALLFEKVGGAWRQTFRGEAPTTVEAPVADVTVGALNAFVEIQELSKREILSTDLDTKESPFEVTKLDSTKGIDLYLSTSSAGGGLQMLVAGVVRAITTESAERAALGAGAIVLEAISADDGRADHERIERMRRLKPDIVLLTGGVDGGSTKHVVEVAETLVAAAPKPRFGNTLKLPVVYAGNTEAAQAVVEILSTIAQVVVVPNVRPTIEKENLIPAREAIHEFFLSHVMSHSPGYDKLMSWSPCPILATPAAVGDIVTTYAKRAEQNVLCVDIGGATTDVFSVFDSRDRSRQIFTRTVSANLGMSYSVANVLVEAGPELIRRWLPYDISDSELRDRLRNKMIRPTSIPQTIEDLWLEQAVCREALRLSLVHHRSLAVDVETKKQARGIADVFKQSSDRFEIIDLTKLDTAIGSGGVISHAPMRMQAALMLVDGFGLEGVTQLAVDSIFMMPHLGVLASVLPEAATEVFERDCLIQLGTCIAPLYPLSARYAEIADVFLDGVLAGTVQQGEVTHMPWQSLTAGEVSLRVVPKRSDIDVGNGKGITVERLITKGECGIILDGRNRPLEKYQFSSASQRKIFNSMGLIQ